MPEKIRKSQPLRFSSALQREFPQKLTEEFPNILHNKLQNQIRRNCRDYFEINDWKTEISEENLKKNGKECPYDFEQLNRITHVVNDMQF